MAINMQGKTVAADDPSRFIWYAADKRCSYWTDDPDKVRDVTRGIPRCPHCGCVGMQTIAAEWLKVRPDFLQSHPRYDEFLPTSKEHCSIKTRVPFLALYAEWMKTNS